eukprot:TRINITY_DN1950_c0_g1_i6.p2 TRINITY_DN1950_c0_g1~~TRINITY_DN1950_c0_g1_i6.p2  ORF type:complete len:112 (-),score=33.03 TRINITY_DN1950_c0_g1_i6:339-674(-)
MYGVFFFFFKQKTAYEMLRSLVGSEMCIRDRVLGIPPDPDPPNRATGEMAPRAKPPPPPPTIPPIIGPALGEYVGGGIIRPLLAWGESEMMEAKKGSSIPLPGVLADPPPF